ncbi:MAG: Asp23/Gls24 family envelope stress response protein [Lachnospiraceae bacterium]|nr:Asp23/Gls24 family envelope stress response protein [Lachnospiraceae bacterium]
MAEDRNSFTIKEGENGGVNIADEVVAIIAGLAATEVDGVASLAGNLTNEVISKAGANKLAKGVKVVAEEDDNLAIRMSVNIAYGYEIPKICQQIQEKVKSAVENMTGLQVVSVDIKIASVSVGNE